MCGIAGIFDLSGQCQPLLADVIAMTAKMIHRGPDDEGFVVKDAAGVTAYFGSDTPVLVRHKRRELCDVNTGLNTPQQWAMGHRRLSILDISPGGHQPMQSDDRRYWLVFNGEIYNFIELREELCTYGHDFKSESDSEVVLAAFQHWGTDCFARFNGDWSLAIVDTHENRLILSRDRFGIKPLYYHVHDRMLAFASEIKAMCASRFVQTKPDIAELKAFLVKGSREWLGKTPFQNIHRFPAAHFAVVNLNDEAPNLHFSRYWDFDVSTEREKFDQTKARRYAEEYLELLKEAVRIRLRSDVQVGSALSGGLDSASIVWLINQLQNETSAATQQLTFSSVHLSEETKHCDESFYIDLLQQQCGFESHRIEPSEGDIQGLHKIVIRSLETPPDGLGIGGATTYQLAKNIGCVVTLDGQGADEQQAGYLYYSINYLNEIPWSELPKFIVDEWGHPERRQMLLFGVARRLLSAVFGRRFVAWLTQRFANNPERFEMGLNASLKSSVNNSLANLIHYSDSRSMYYSIESRMPFLDHRLVEFTAKIPAVYKIRNGFTKYFARMAFEGKLPDAIVWRRDKMGWPMPDEYWINGQLRDWLQTQVDECPVFREMGVSTNLGGASTRRKMRMLNIAAWYREFF